MPFREIPGFSSNNQGGAKCSFCGQHARKWPNEERTSRTYSTDLYIHMEGPVEACERCIHEAGLLIGMQPEAVVRLLKVGLEELTAQLDEAERELTDKSAAISLLAGELAATEDAGAAKAAVSYEKGYSDGRNEALLEVEEPDFAGGGA